MFKCRIFSLKLCKSSLTVEIDRAFGIFQNKKKKKFVKIFLGKMAPVKFAIPLQRKDLRRSNSDNTYVVENEYSIRELKTKLVVS